jgi:hypothetical protein
LLKLGIVHIKCGFDQKLFIAQVHIAAQYTKKVACLPDKLFRLTFKNFYQLFAASRRPHSKCSIKKGINSHGVKFRGGRGGGGAGEVVVIYETTGTPNSGGYSGGGGGGVVKIYFYCSFGNKLPGNKGGADLVGV